MAPWVHTDRDTKTLDDAFALHWNGNRKPWDLDRCDEETRSYFLRYLARSPDSTAATSPSRTETTMRSARAAAQAPRTTASSRTESSATKASVAGSRFDTWDQAYAWYANVYKFTEPKDITEGYTEADWPGMAITIDDCEAICASHFPSGAGVHAGPQDGAGAQHP